MDRQDILRTLADRDRYPVATIAYCLDDRDRSISIFLPLLQRAAEGKSLSQEENDALFLGCHILGALKISTAFAPLMQLALDRPDRLTDILGENAIGQTFPRLLMGLAEGEETALWYGVNRHGCDFLIRDAFLRAWTYSVFEARISRVAAVRLLRDFLDGDASPPPDDLIWSGWLTAVSDLGLIELKPVAERAILSKRILQEDPGLDDKQFREFEQALKDALPEDDRPTVMAERGYTPFGTGSKDWGDAFLLAPGDTVTV
ncbi:hypothetical protein E1180_06270 [Roseibium denhamense]|uniref:DUF1186 domain-containing protein n=1 Tax=Roseibium denhamense TaxID=76305 RepID=A0ABY1P1Q5_9HYPH|nr:hypothetical protein [Roseibium denhamense]MTI05117.1 hypothetical protein [Roseibium denhamense]SMP22793.1 hypothetical protein SAMN06265374_2201 [Roseibium denhamense]